MNLYFLKNYTYNGAVIFEKGMEYFVNNDMLARYLIRKKIAVSPVR